ncbi:MAG: iron-sulfur cluster assembly scaffold protein [Phycisphaerae bacterium]|jgi:NifU-like protein involved in Fe-S cluster formation
MFTPQAIERFRNPKNTGDLKRYNAMAKAGDPSCSDVIIMKVRFNGDVVEDAKFKVFGCPGAVSTTDVFIDLAKGKRIEDALKITEGEVSDALGGLPTAYMHCSNLSMEAFQKCVNKYRKNKR